MRHRRWRAPGVERSTGRPADVFHSLRYRLFLVYVDLAELPALFGRRGIWSTRWPALAWFRRADYLGAAAEPLEQAVRRLVRERLGWSPSGPIRLLTSFRYAGFRMNPVSFYYCFDESGEQLETLIAEVTNTPWDERHHYVLDLREAARGDLAARWSARNDKEFHVSPFFDLAMEYYWRVTVPREKLLVHIENHAADGKPFDATLLARRQPLTRWNLARVLLQYPLLTMKVAAGIYWHALQLWWKGVPYVPHPGPVKSTSSRKSAPNNSGSSDFTEKPFFDPRQSVNHDGLSQSHAVAPATARDSHLLSNVADSIPEVHR